VINNSAIGLITNRRLTALVSDHRRA